MAGIVALPPVILSPVHLNSAVIIEVGFGGVPFRFVFFKKSISADFCQSFGGCIAGKTHLLVLCSAARICRVFLPERKNDAVDGSRFLSDKSGKVYRIIFPAVHIFRTVFTQPERVLVNQPPGTSQFAGRGKGICLHKHQHVVLENADDAQIHCIKIDCPEWDDQAFGVGQDSGRSRHFHLRFQIELAERDGVGGTK